MSFELPENWVQCEIGEVTKVVGGGTPPSKDLSNFTTQGGTPWITPADLSGYKYAHISKGARNLSDKGFAACSAVKMPAGSVLFSSRAPVGYVAIASTEVTTNQGFKSFVLPESIESRFVYYYLRHIKPIAEMMATGTTFKELSGSAAAKLPFLLAPLNEQKRIADKLDTLLARVDACRERLDRVPQILKRFRQAVLAAATSGALTEEWREHIGIVSHDVGDSLMDFPEGWKVHKIGDVFSLIDGDRGPNYPKQHDYLPAGHCLFLSTKNVRPFGFLFDETVYISEQKHKLLRNGTLQRGDIIITTRGTLGNVAVYDESVPYSTIRINSGMLIIRNKGFEIHNDFVKYFIASPFFSVQLNKKQSGSAQPQIPAGVLKSFSFPLPPLPEQNEIVRRVETLFAFADRLETRYSTGREQVDQLIPSLLDKAFRGELVPQDPSDEPAEKLLERIKTSKQATDDKPKRGRQKRC